MNIFLTLDYELFLGANTGTPENCLIRPMKALCDAVEKYGARFTIFVDAAYLLQLKLLKNNFKQLQKDYDIVCANIKDLHQRGHDIQLHFHPQWLYSQWDKTKNEWKLDYAHYKLSDMDSNYAFHVFAEAKQLLESLLNKRIIAFRAGGYCLESFCDYILLFEQNDIRIDSSVARGRYNFSGIHYFDYRQIPSIHQVYRFNTTIREEVCDGRFVEVPISFCRWNKLDYLRVMRAKGLLYSPKLIFGDGSSIGKMERKQEKHGIIKKFLKRLAPISMSASSSGSASVFLKDMYNQAIKLHWDELVIIGHPKEETDASIANLEDFVREMCKTNNFKCVSEI